TSGTAASRGGDPRSRRLSLLPLRLELLPLSGESVGQSSRQLANQRVRLFDGFARLVHEAGLNAAPPGPIAGQLVLDEQRRRRLFYRLWHFGCRDPAFFRHG